MERKLLLQNSIIIVAFLVMFGLIFMVDASTIEAERKMTFPGKKDTATSIQPSFDVNAQSAPRETRIRFKNFTIIFHNFKGYALTDNPDPAHWWDDQVMPDTASLRVNWSEKYAWMPTHDLKPDLNENYKETLLARKDTVILAESYAAEDYQYPNLLENPLIQVVPRFEGDSFTIEQCYVSGIYQAFDETGRSKEELEELYTRSIRIEENTEFTHMFDTATYFFREKLYTPEVTTLAFGENGMQTVKRDERAERNQKIMESANKEATRLAAKHGLSQAIGVEGTLDPKRTLTKDGLYFNAGISGHLFKVTRFHKGKKAESRYLKVSLPTEN